MSFFWPSLFNLLAAMSMFTTSYGVDVFTISLINKMDKVVYGRCGHSPSAIYGVKTITVNPQEFHGYIFHAGTNQMAYCSLSWKEEDKAFNSYFEAYNETVADFCTSMAGREFGFVENQIHICSWIVERHRLVMSSPIIHSFLQNGWHEVPRIPS